MKVDGAGPDLVGLTLVNLGLIFALTAVISLVIGAVMRRRGDGQGAGKAASLWKRMLTFAFLAPLALIPAFFGGWPLALFVALLVVCCSMELWGLAGRRPPAALAFIILSLAVPASTTLYGPFAASVSLGVLLAATAIFRALSPRSPAADTLSVASAIALYTAVLLSALILIRVGPAGAGGLFFTLLVIQIADVGAMLGGLLLGRTALAPRLSPGKTAEGFASGVAAAMVVGFLFRRALAGYSIAEILAISALLASYGLLGDLLASALKRRAGRKDFGKILPGHGGFMDRADSVLVASPAAWMLLGFGSPAASLVQRSLAYAAVGVWGCLALLAIRFFFGSARANAAPAEV